MSEQGTSETGGHVLAVELSLAPGATPRIGSPVQISIAVRNEADADVLMVGVIDGFRWCLLGVENIYWTGFWLSVVITILLLLSGVKYFRKTERSFADNI